MPQTQTVDLFPTLRQRLRISPSQSSVAASLPVLFFGDALNARVATIGLNPSKREYLDAKGEPLGGLKQRFATTTCLGAASREDLSDAQADAAIKRMQSYYDPDKPVYDSYFRHLCNFLDGLGAGFNERSAAHLDLVQESTDPTWSNLSASEQTALLTRDLPFLDWQLNNFKTLEIVICTGKTVSDRVRPLVTIDNEQIDKTKLLRWWHGSASLADGRVLKIGGWNYPLHQPNGLGSDGERKLGKMFADAFR
jgi:uracil-DNA glycosylase